MGFLVLSDSAWDLASFPLRDGKDLQGDLKERIPSVVGQVNVNVLITLQQGQGGFVLLAS